MSCCKNVSQTTINNYVFMGYKQGAGCSEAQQLMRRKLQPLVPGTSSSPPGPHAAYPTKSSRLRPSPSSPPSSRPCQSMVYTHFFFAQLLSSLLPFRPLPTPTVVHHQHQHQQSLTAPHIESYNFFLEDGLSEAVKDLPQQVMQVRLGLLLEADLTCARARGGWGGSRFTEKDGACEAATVVGHGNTASGCLLQLGPTCCTCAGRWRSVVV